MAKFAESSRKIILRGIVSAVGLISSCGVANAQKGVRLGVSVRVPISPSSASDGMIGFCLVLFLICVALAVLYWVLYFAWAWTCERINDCRSQGKRGQPKQTVSHNEKMRDTYRLLADCAVSDTIRKEHLETAQKYEHLVSPKQTFAEMERAELCVDDDLMPLPKYEKATRNTSEAET